MRQEMSYNTLTGDVPSIRVKSKLWYTLTSAAGA
jgi:hypothetical protein